MKITDITDFIGVTDSRRNQPIEPSSKKFDREDIGEKKILLSWDAVPKVIARTVPLKLKKTMLVIGIVVLLLFMLMKEFSIIIVIFSIFFMIYALSKYPVESQKYELSTHGFSISGRMYYWDEMEKFFFNEESGVSTLAIDLKEGLAKRVFIAYHKKDKQKIVDILNDRIQYLETAPLTILDKAYNKVLDKFDFEPEKEK